MGDSSLDALNRLLDLWLPEDEPITPAQRAWADELLDILHVVGRPPSVAL